VIGADTSLCGNATITATASVSLYVSYRTRLVQSKSTRQNSLHEVIDYFLSPRAMLVVMLAVAVVFSFTTDRDH